MAIFLVHAAVVDAPAIFTNDQPGGGNVGVLKSSVNGKVTPTPTDKFNVNVSFAGTWSAEPLGDLVQNFKTLFPAGIAIEGNVAMAVFPVGILTVIVFSTTGSLFNLNPAIRLVIVEVPRFTIRTFGAIVPGQVRLP